MEASTPRRIACDALVMRTPIAEKAITGASGVPAERIGLLGYILAKRTYLISET